MCLHVAAIHGHAGRNPLPGGQRLQYPMPVLAPGPAIEAIIHRGRGTVFRRAVLPAAAALQHMNNPTDNPTVINTRRTNGMAGKVWLNRRPRFIRKPENLPHSIPQGANHALESHSYSNFNALLQF